MTRYQTWCVLCNTYILLKKHGVDLIEVEDLLEDRGVPISYFGKIQYGDLFRYAEKLSGRDIHSCLHLMGVNEISESSYCGQKGKGLVLKM